MNPTFDWKLDNADLIDFSESSISTDSYVITMFSKFGQKESKLIISMASDKLLSFISTQVREILVFRELRISQHHK